MVVSIHQPRSTVWQMFDGAVCCLICGWLFWFWGSVGEVWFCFCSGIDHRPPPPSLITHLPHTYNTNTNTNHRHHPPQRRAGDLPRPQRRGAPVL